MDRNKLIKIGLITILVVLVIITLVQGNAHSNAKRLTKELTIQVDTLTSTLDDYNDLKSKYVDLQNEMVKTSNELSDFKVKLDAISRAQQSSLRDVKNKLTDLVIEFDSVQVNLPADSISIDDLKF